MSEGKRRLAGILAADVAGYSAVVAADEPASVAGYEHCGPSSSRTDRDLAGLTLIG
jgi:hypothetical protein